MRLKFRFCNAYLVLELILFLINYSPWPDVQQKNVKKYIWDQPMGVKTSKLEVVGPVDNRPSTD